MGLHPTAISQASSKPLRQVREQLTDTCVKALLAYRKHCASSTSPAQVCHRASAQLLVVLTLLSHFSAHPPRVFQAVPALRSCAHEVKGAQGYAVIVFFHYGLWAPTQLLDPPQVVLSLRTCVHGTCDSPSRSVSPLLSACYTLACFPFTCSRTILASPMSAVDSSCHL